jgi:hypothetical protein
LFNVANIINIITNINNSTNNTITNISEPIINNEITDNEIIELSIPILWIPCSGLIKIFNESRLFKKILETHYKKCEKCEINNNNRFDLDFSKKIVVKEIERTLKSSSENEEIDAIIKCYQFSNKLIDTQDKFDLYEYDETKINIIYYKDIDNIYNKCLFILTD